MGSTVRAALGTQLILKLGIPVSQLYELIFQQWQVRILRIICRLRWQSVIHELFVLPLEQPHLFLEQVDLGMGRRHFLEPNMVVQLVLLLSLALACDPVTAPESATTWCHRKRALPVQVTSARI